MAAERTNDDSLAAGAVVSHGTAAEMWGIGDLWSDGIHFIIPSRKQSRQPEVHFHRDDLTDNEWTIHRDTGLPITTAARTILDLAKNYHEPGHLLTLVADAARMSLVTQQQLLDTFTGRENALGVRRGSRQQLCELLDEYFSRKDLKEGLNRLHS